MSDENSTLGTEALNIVAHIRIPNIDQWGPALAPAVPRIPMQKSIISP